MEICVCKNLLGNVLEFDSYGGEKEVRLHTRIIELQRSHQKGMGRTSN